MRAHDIGWRKSCAILGGAVLLSGALGGWPASCEAAEETAPPDGRELFMREWIPNDPRSHNGDGLGPLFNDSSCVACHNQGGVGGGGPRAKNAQIISAVAPVNPFDPQGTRQRKAPKPEDRQAAIDRQRKELSKLHPGFATTRSLVLHRFSAEPEYAAFRGKLLGLETPASTFGRGGREFGSVGFDKNGVRREIVAILTASQLSDLNRVRSEALAGTLDARQLGRGNTLDAALGNFTLLLSERNTIALFGSGKIDAIPDDVLLAAAEKRFADFPEIEGRVARLKDGGIGRFGWKAQKARLAEFVLTACAVELGLHVPHMPQSGLPHQPDYQPPGLDLTETECHSLISYVAGLRQPAERTPTDAVEAEYLAEGRAQFAAVGCAACHTAQLGKVAGIYSDLLLHDMGPELSDSGSYGGFVPNSTEDEEFQRTLPVVESSKESQAPNEARLIGARRQEWRTPPLWGLRDSAPYLHDGRAATIEQAIALHGGEGQNAARRFFRLKPAERLQVTSFLRSLAAPE